MDPIWTLWMVLSMSATGILSFPEPDRSYNIPEVGTGRRAQYYILHNDGTYKYGHDTGEGIFESVKQKKNAELEGEFGYTNDDGQTITLQYEAGQNGFVARGAHLPASHPDFITAQAEAQARAEKPFIDLLTNPNADALYDFQYLGEEQFRSEQSDAKGNVQGSYSFIDDEGLTRTYTYTAGSNTGFLIQGDDIPHAIKSISSNHEPLTSILSPVSLQPARANNGNPSTFQSPSSSSSESGVLTYNTPSVIISQNHPDEQNLKSSTLTAGGGHTLNYKTSTHERAESIGLNNKVVGNFAFVADDDGLERTVQYSASADTGFIVESDHLPVGPEVPGAPSGRPTGRLVPVQQIPFIDPLASSNSDASYQFSHQSQEQARREQSNSEGTVRGSYSYVDDEGRRRSYTYTAGKGIGFQIEGDDGTATPQAVLPESLPGVTKQPNQISGTSPSLQVYSTPQAAAATNAHNSFSSVASPLSFTSPVEVIHPENNRVQRPTLGSHVLNYKTPTHERRESIGHNNKVVGNFAFTAEDDGVQRVIQYEASATTGFTVDGDHLPIGPGVPGAPSGKPTGKLTSVRNEPFVDPLANSNSDAAYNFAFDTEQYSRTETSDSNGNVQGTYTITDDDGTRRTYRFRAGDGIGFEVQEATVSEGPQTSEASRPISYGTPSEGLQAASSSIHSAHTSDSLGQQESVKPSSLALENTSLSTSPHQDFHLEQYDAVNNPDKFGYVLTFGN